MKSFLEHVAEDLLSRYGTNLSRVAVVFPNKRASLFLNEHLARLAGDEFKNFIGDDMRLEQVNLHKTDLVKELLAFYMGKNTMERQSFIINNLVIEEDLVTEDFMI